ncbi:MAG: glycosyltransferase family 2 protein [Candidatus Aminicenantes bacterium]|nr:glycosyltransferase family 2 protein [Candidatus Aminicenantes bacterium]
MKKIVVLSPAYNEEQSIASVLRKIPRKWKADIQVEVVVIDDGSTDRTAEIALQEGAEVFSHTRNMGLGVAFRKGLHRGLEKGADVIVNIDADGQFNAEDIPKLVEPILQGKAGFVTASRFKSADLRPKMPLIKRIGNRFISCVISRIVGGKYKDVSCGFRAYSRDAALKLNLFGRFTYTQETFIDLAVKDVSILEVPVKVTGERRFGKSKISSNLFVYGFKTMRIIIGALRDFKPMVLFTFFSLFWFVIGSITGIFFMDHYLRTGSFRPQTWAVFVSAGSFLLALFLMITGLVMNMFGRMRINQEKLIFFARKNYYDKYSNSDKDISNAL